MALALKVKPHDITEYMIDGRRASFFIERRLVSENIGWSLAPSESSGYDILDENNEKWEVRCLTKFGVYFTPSNQVGSGRKFDEVKFLQKLSAIKGYIVSDIVTFPSVEIYCIPSGNVLRWYQDGRLGVNAKISRNKFLKSLSNDINY